MTLKATTQRGIRTMLHPSLNRRFKTNDRMLRYRRLNTDMYTDTMVASKKSLRGNNCGQIYVNDIDFTRFYHMKDRTEVPATVLQFFHEEGVPTTLILDGSREQISQKVIKTCSDANYKIKRLEFETRWANRAEMGIRELKRGVRRLMRFTNAPLRLWDYCAQLQAKIRSSNAHNNRRLEGEVPQTLIDGSTADISSLAEFSWCELIKYRDSTTSFPLDDWTLGRWWLGPAPSIGNKMAFYLLKSNREVVVRTTLRLLTEEESTSDNEQENRKCFDISLKKILGDLITDDDLPHSITRTHQPFENVDGKVESLVIEADDIQDYDRYIQSQIIIPIKVEYLMKAKVIGRVHDDTDKPKGTYNPNPMIDTREYEVMFDDGTIKEYSANIIAENLISLLGDKGHSHQFFSEIIDHRTDGKAVSKNNGTIIRNGISSMRKTTKGLYFCVKWKDDSTSWVHLKYLKQSNPLEVSEYAVANKLVSEPAFQW